MDVAITIGPFLSAAVRIIAGILLATPAIGYLTVEYWERIHGR